MAHHRGFTLVEMLVVVAIIALLLAILLPSLSKSRRIARQAYCSAGLKQVGEAWYIFAHDNNRRGPGRAENNLIPPSPFQWHDILNIEVLGAEMTHINSTLTPIQRFNSPGDGTIGLASGSIGCPEIATYADSFWRRPWIANSNMCGGPNWIPQPNDNPLNPSNGGPGLYGKSAPNRGYPGDWYMLGTRMDVPRQPASTFLVYEADQSNDDQPYRHQARPADVTEEDPIEPVNGWFAFRHPSLVGNFLYVDGHVRSRGHDDDTISPATKEQSPHQLD